MFLRFDTIKSIMDSLKDLWVNFNIKARVLEKFVLSFC